MRTNRIKAYARAGVDVELGNTLKREIQSIVRSTHGPEVLGKIGGFSGLFRVNFKGMKDPVLVSSVDGVGTKLKVAFAMDRHDTIGQDLVNHCINDIAVLGARPLFFLDYVAAGKLEPAVFRQLLGGLAKACRAAGCAIIGGETAQMPGMYREGEYDVAGTIVGVVDRPKMLDGSLVRPGDVLIGLPSDGLHTNGFSLARRVLFEDMGLKTSSRLPELRLTLGEELLRVHQKLPAAHCIASDGPGPCRGAHYRWRSDRQSPACSAQGLPGQYPARLLAGFANFSNHPAGRFRRSGRNV